MVSAPVIIRRRESACFVNKGSESAKGQVGVKAYSEKRKDILSFTIFVTAIFVTAFYK